MTMRLILAAVLAIAMVFSSFIAHTVFLWVKLGSRNLQTKRSPPPWGSIWRRPRSLCFPRPRRMTNATREKRESHGADGKDYASKPSGFLVYHSPGSWPFAFGNG